MRAGSYKLSIALVFLFCLLAGQTVWGQPVMFRDHKKVPFSKNMTLRIIDVNGLTIQGRWQMENSEAVSLKLRSGHEIIVAKADVAEIYKCDRQTNFGFFVGFMSGTLAALAVVGIAGSGEGSDYAWAPLVGVVCGLAGAVIGSLHYSCERIDLENLPSDVTGAAHIEKRTIGLRWTYKF